MSEQEYQPAVICPNDLLKDLPAYPLVNRARGAVIRVRENQDAVDYLRSKYRVEHGNCGGQPVEVHPDDVAKNWPEMQPSAQVAICSCCLLTD